MRADDIRLLFDHLYWIRDRIMAAAAQAEEALVDAAPVTIRDLRTTLVHELDVEWSWRERLRGVPFETWGPDGELKPSSYPDLSALAAHWRADEATMRAWLAGLSDDEVTGPWELEGPGGLPLWQHLMHLYTHALQQFSDAAVLLTRAGRSPGELDFLEFIESRRRRLPI